MSVTLRGILPGLRFTIHTAHVTAGYLADDDKAGLFAIYGYEVRFSNLPGMTKPPDIDNDRNDCS